jgi:hypothetical protein
VRCVTQKSFHTFRDRQDLPLAHQCDAKNGLDHGIRSTSVSNARLCCLTGLIAHLIVRMENKSGQS